MKAGYTGDELKQIDQERTVRRSFFQTSRRLETKLRTHELWPVYKALRQAATGATAEAVAQAGAGADQIVDAHLESTLPEMLKQLEQLFQQDKEARQARARIATWDWQDPMRSVELARATQRRDGDTASRS